MFEDDDEPDEVDEVEDDDEEAADEVWRECRVGRRW